MVLDICNAPSSRRPRAVAWGAFAGGAIVTGNLSQICRKVFGKQKKTRGN